ncbi:uncharacterized protein LOC117967637 isoform X1 [Acipenser ruthenus]|uniref:uncharacterized protein LOC117967637 isoform X1 n=1 Tax=Acipenser ruthenus TaxID=7906 RepID=UPI0027419BED|nr:uncharacterized protein LOC117967637 isoform X1 [Acipenser ruthenus]
MIAAVAERITQLACETDAFYKKMTSSGTSLSTTEERDVTTQKACCLIGLLVEKGHAACGKFISKLAERDLNLYSTLRLLHDSWRLYRMIPEFIKSAAVLEGLLKDMQEMKQLSDGEVEEVMKQESTWVRTSHLTSIVMRKGDAFRENLLSKLGERNPEFYSVYYPDLDPVDRLIQVQSQFVESVSDAVMEELLKDMLEMKVLSDEDVEEVRDAPQNTGLQSWLVEQINSGRYPGLSWTNEALKQFRIPWKHDDQKDLTPEDTMIFKGWAVATGCYREGIDQPDPAYWRRHFQRAVDKDECLVLRADHSRDPVDPHKIYRSEDILADKRAKVKLEKTHCLISLLVEKGRTASGKFIFRLAERDLNLYRSLRLHLDSRILCRMIPEFIKSAAVLEGLLKDMQEMKLLSDGEVEEVKKQASTQDRISHLTSMVMRKGDAIRENLLFKLTERNPKFYNTHGPDLDPVNRLMQVQSQFVERVSDAVMEGLLMDMLEMKVLSDEDVEEMRDAPQNTGLQPWLVEQINSGLYPGLSWTNEALKQFRIPWKHDDQKDLTTEDTMIFKDWAVATGRYREGIDQPDWRRHFQRALDKDEILVLRADHSRDPVDPHKIYWSEDILADKRTKVKLEKARCLISLVVEKGRAASGKLISKLAERDPKFYNTHGPDLDPVDRLIQVQSQFVESVSDAVMEGLLKDMLEMKVLSDEDVEEVRDAPQNTGLQPWLVEQINSGLYPGLSWTNEALKQFRIPWKHDDQKDLTPEDTMIFKDWAVATGRYREGIDQPDTADWRRHFQRALDKDEILVLRADHSRDPVDPHKIYWSEDILADKRAKVKLEKARCLISLLVEKERAASGKLISKLAERDLNLYRTLRLHHDSRILCHMIPEFIESTAVLNGLLKEMQEMKLLSDGEVEEVKKQPHPSHRISHLTRMVMKKEDAIRENLLSKLTERKPKFYNIHRPDLDPVDRLMQVQSQFVESVSDAVMEGLLKDMLEMKVLSDEDVEEVRDAPQNTGLQSWLVEQINSGRYPGLSWTNEALKQFRIPWKHDDRKDLTPEDTMIFKDWAVVTGRYREGIDQPNPPDWRRHFQCAMDKDECLVLRADHSRDPVDPHKIYWSEDILADKRAKVKLEKACCLISLLVGKGHGASGKFIFKLAERNLNLYRTLSLHRDRRSLVHMIPKFIKSDAVLEGLLKDMQEMKQLSDGEVEEVKKQASTQCRASHLTSMVMKKGDAIRENFLFKLAERDPEFYTIHCPYLNPVDRLMQVQSQFVESVSDAVMEGLLKDMLEMKVLSDEDVEEVRDAPQNTGLQSWLVEQINSGRYPGLSWTNEVLKQFRIPWKHDDRLDLTPEDTMIFKDWAVATGRYREGIDQPDPAAWRRNFQRALDKDECLVLRADHSRDPVDPHKIYISNADSRLEERGNRLTLKVTELTTFRPTIHHEGHHKYYRFSFKKEGEYQCEITALIFDMVSPAEVVYGTEQWEKCPLDQSSLLPAGPLYDINSPSGALKQLSFPHSECSPEVQNHLMVAHYKNDNVEMIKPSEVTETHIKIKVTEMSLFGLVRRWLKYKSKAQVLLFLRQLTERKKLNVFLLSSNIVLDDVQEKQKDSIFIETSSRCVVLEEEKYSVSCDQENAHVQPDTYDFVRDYGPNFHPTFEIFLNNDVKGLTLEVFKSTKRDASVWSRRVWLDETARCTSNYVQSETAAIKPRPTPLQAGERLKAVRTRLIEGLNASVIRDLLDDMLHMNVLNDGEVERVKEGQTCTKDKASCLIDMVRKKGSSASEKLISKLAERDPVLYVTLGLHRQSVD